MEHSYSQRPLHSRHSPLADLRAYDREPSRMPSRRVTLEDEPEIITHRRNDGARYWDSRPGWDQGGKHGMGVTTIPRRSRVESPQRHRDRSGRSRSGSLERLIVDRDQYHDLITNQSTTQVVKPHAPQDITVHMSLPVQDDLEETLEEYSRLRRFGHFRDAIELFEKELEHFLDNRYVLFQYCLCLLEAGEYGRLAGLTPKILARPMNAYDLLDVAIRLLLCKAELDSVEPETLLSASQGAEEMVRSSWPTIDSTEARVLSWIVYKAFSSYDGLSDWKVMYNHLVDKGMIWEFRDIIQELIQHYNIVHVLNKFVGSSTVVTPTATTMMSPLDRLREHWDTDATDDSTSLALLDIFTSLALMYKEDAEQDENATKCMNLATEYAMRLVGQDENYTLSRPYLRWTVARLLVKERYPNKFDDSILFTGWQRGTVKVPRFSFPIQSLPIYVPIENDVPEWQPRPSSDQTGAAVIRTVLGAAEELGDVEMQAACLRELMYRGDEPPRQIIKKLKRVWQSSGNMQMIRILHLFRYMLAHTPAARKQLRRDILTDGEIWRNRSLHVAQKMILAALSTDVMEKAHYRYQASSIDDQHHNETKYEHEHHDERRGSRRHDPRAPPLSPRMESLGAGPVVTVGRTRHPRTRSESPVRRYFQSSRREPSSPRLSGREPTNASRHSNNPPSDRTLKDIIDDIKTVEYLLRQADGVGTRDLARLYRDELERLNDEQDTELNRLRQEVADARGLGQPVADVAPPVSHSVSVNKTPTGRSNHNRNHSSDESDDSDDSDDNQEDDRASQKTARVEDSAEGNSEVNIVTVKSPEPINPAQRGPYLLGFPGYGGVSESDGEEGGGGSGRTNSGSLD